MTTPPIDSEPSENKPTMDADRHEALEETIRALHDAGAYDRAVTVALEGYGAEISRTQLTLVRGDVDRARDAYSQFCEDLWKGVEKFEWRSKFRTWMHTLARNAVFRQARDAYRKRRVTYPTDGLGEVVEQSFATGIGMTTAFGHLMALITELDEEDQWLLVYRDDLELAWNDIAPIFYPDEATDPKTVRKLAARLRKRYQRARDQLRDIAQEAGLRLSRKA